MPDDLWISAIKNFSPVKMTVMIKKKKIKSFTLVKTEDEDDKY